MATIMTTVEITPEMMEFIRHYRYELENTNYLSHLTPHMTKFYKRVVSFIRAEKNWLHNQTLKTEGWAKFDKEEDPDELPADAAWGIYLSRVMKRVRVEALVIQREMAWSYRRRYEDTWRRSYKWMNNRYGGNLQFGALEVARLEQLGRERVQPALTRNMDRLSKGIEKAGKTAKTPQRFIGRIGFLHPLSHDYKGGWLRRLCYTEKHAHLTEAHVTGMEKLGESRFRRLVTLDDVTSVDLCLPFADVVYAGHSAHGVVPAHPWCRCMMLPFIKTISVVETPRPVEI